ILVSQQVFVGHQQMTVYTIFAGFLYMIGKTIINLNLKKVQISKVFNKILVFFIIIGIASLLSLVILIPSYELLKLSTRSVMELQVSWYPFPVKHLLTFLDPFLFGNPKYGTYPIISEHWGIFWENTGYVGIIPLILLGLSLFLLKKPSLFLFGLLLFSLLFILGKYSPLYFIHEFPPFSLFRVPSRFLFFVDLLIALLAGYTLRAIFIKSKRILQYEGFVVILLILIHTINIFYYFYNYHPVGKVDEWYQTPKVIEYLKRDKSRFRIFTIDNTSQWNEIFLKEGWRHPEKYLQFREAMIGHENFFYGIPKSNFYTSFVTKRMKAVNDLLFGDIKKEKNDIRIGTNAASLLGIMNVKYILSPLPVRDFEKVFESNGISLYKNAHFQNRVIFARQYKKIDTLNDVKNTLISREFDPENVVLLEKDVQGDFIACDDPKSSCQVNLNIQIDIPGHLVVNVNSDRDGIVVFSDSYYPGWEARVDNRPVAILAANINQKAVVVKRGKHIVSFIYQPQTVRLGATVSAIGYLVVLIALLFLIRKRH
ncbi:YfhO family protein, partial [Candidatus Roizmanbacteria bacterium]|nr:YfhO family protein [Candidatus Roizmanbacteria bacterium]